MGFARKVWHLLVAIKDGLVLSLLLLFFMALFAALTARPSPGQVREGALLVKLDGAVVEEPSVADPLEALLSDQAPLKEYRARDLVRALDAAAGDDKIKAVVLDLSRFTGGGLVHMTDIGAALDRVRAAKKPVLTFATAYTDDGVQLAAHSTEVWVDPLGGAFVTGPGGNRLYFGALLQRLKISTHVFKVGTYKDFVEPYLYDKASQPSKDARRALYGAVWENWKADVARARPKADIARVTGDPVAWLKASGGDAAQAALAAGLVDKIGDKVAFGERVKALVGEDFGSERPGSYAHTRIPALLAAHPASDKGDPVAVVTVAGEIVDGKAGPGTAGGARIAKLIDKATADEAKALVLRVDSPGCFGLLLLAFAGIPLTSGFTAKFAVFAPAIAHGDLMGTILVVIGVLASGVTAYIYFRIIVLMYFEDAPGGDEVVALNPGIATTVVVTVGVLATLLLGIVPGLLLEIANSSSLFLL